MQDVSVSWRGGLPQLVEELRRQKESKVDFVADTRTVRVEARTNNSVGELVLLPEVGNFQVGEFITSPQRLSERAIEQLGSRFSPDIPGKFARQLAALQPTIAANLFNEMRVASASRVMFRCLDGRVRAALSNKYRILDDLDIAFSALDVIQRNRGTVLECSASDSRMEIKFTATHMVDYIPESRGGGGSAKHISRSTLDPNQFKSLGQGAVCPFVRITHSSVGEGGLGIGFGLLRLACMNGAVTDQVMNQIHLGSVQSVGMLSDETIAADSKAIMLKCRDLIQTSLDPASFSRVVGKAKNAATDEIEAPTSAVSNLVNNTGMSEKDQDAILQYFLRDYDQNRWGLSQAISRYSQDCDDAVEASELEAIAGKVMTGGELLAV